MMGDGSAIPVPVAEKGGFPLRFSLVVRSFFLKKLYKFEKESILGD